MGKAIDYFSYDNPLIKVKTFFSCKARKKMFLQFTQAFQPTSSDEVLDLGVTPDTRLADSNFFEKLYPYKNKLTVASIEDCEFLVRKYGLKAFVQNRPKEPLPFRDEEFDILFCSAVLEHVGTREDQKFFLEECLRISKKIFVTTPNRYFPIEMHTFLPLMHWLPWTIFQKIVRILKGEFWADINNLNLLSSKDIKKMMGNSMISISFIKTLGWTSNLVITRGSINNISKKEK